MKTMRRLLAVLMAAVLLCVGMPLAFAEGETTYQVGDQIQFGTYPQTRVDETPELKAAAEAAVWTSYGYYTGTGQYYGPMWSSDYMRFTDFFYAGEKYRAVFFSLYRKDYTGYIADTSTYSTYQDDNGYMTDEIYYFKYEPLIWRVLDPETGFITCEMLIDAQAYQNTIFVQNNHFWQDDSMLLPVTNYETSSIRSWLNFDFYETAFSDEQKTNIRSTTIDNSGYVNYETGNAYSGSMPTNDKVFLLSQSDVENQSYEIDRWALIKDGDWKKQSNLLSTDYSKSQGIFGTAGLCLLRTASDAFYSLCLTPDGAWQMSPSNITYYGIRPACVLSKLKPDISQSENLFSSGTHIHQAGEAVTENKVAATCKATGSYDAVTYCTVCGEEMSRETVYEGNPLGHLEQTYTTPSTCAENGFTITICTRCGETLSKEILPRLDHNWTSEVTQNPTCTAQGVKTYTCADCGETYTEPVDVLAHQWDDGKMTKAPSCTEAGEMTYTCATGGETRTEPIDKLDHEIVLVAGKAASCTEPGLTDGWQCKNCKKWFAEQQTISALNHDPQIGAVVEPTCTDPGYTPFICTRCGETVSKTDPTDALGHNPKPVYTWADDDSTVTATMVCTRCDKTGMTETAEVKTEITVKPTCSTEGELTLIAAFNNKSFYGQTKTKTLPRDPNAHVFKVTVTQPTCLDDGYTTHACTLCRYGYSDEIVSAPGHDYQHHDAKAPTCEAPGWDAYDTCSRCDYTTYSELATVDHDDADNDGKCDMCGDQMQGGSHCKYCGKIHGGAFGWLTKLIHSILAVFKR